MAWVGRLRRYLSGSSVHHCCVLARTFLKFVLDEDTLPRGLRRALTARKPRPVSERRLVSKEQFEASLEAAATYPSARQVLRAQSMLWGLKETWFRASEFVALNVGSVEFTRDGGAFVSLPAGASRLKTGPRRIYVLEWVPVLRAWLAIHPQPGDPQAPLHPQQRPGPERRRTTYDGLLQMLRTLCKRAGLPPLSPHDYRHTGNTEAARNQWDPQLREKKAGWAPGSKMSSYYTHLVDDDLVAQVRRDAGADGHDKSRYSPGPAHPDHHVRTALRRILGDSP